MAEYDELIHISATVETRKMEKEKPKQKTSFDYFSMTVTTFKVLFKDLSQESDLLFQGRLEGQAQEIDGYILINDMPENFEPKVGAIYNVRIAEAHNYDLIGEII